MSRIDLEPVGDFQLLTEPDDAFRLGNAQVVHDKRGHWLGAPANNPPAHRRQIRLHTTEITGASDLRLASTEPPPEPTMKRLALILAATLVTAAAAVAQPSPQAIRGAVLKASPTQLTVKPKGGKPLPST